MSVADKIVTDISQDVTNIAVSAVLQVQRHMFRQRADPIGIGDGLHQLANVSPVDVR
jgi:hypothetical protein